MGWGHSQYMGKSNMFQSPPTSHSHVQGIQATNPGLGVPAQREPEAWILSQEWLGGRGSSCDGKGSLDPDMHLLARPNQKWIQNSLVFSIWKSEKTWFTYWKCMYGFLVPWFAYWKWWSSIVRCWFVRALPVRTLHGLWPRLATGMACWNKCVNDSKWHVKRMVCFKLCVHIIYIVIRYHIVIYSTTGSSWSKWYENNQQKSWQTH